MAPKKKTANKKAAGGGGGGDEIDPADVKPITVANIVVGEIKEVEKVPDGTLLKCLVQVPDSDEEAFIITPHKVEEGMKLIVALAPVPLPNGVQVEMQQLAGLDSEGMFCTPRDLLWPSSAFKADGVIQLLQAEVGPVPSYEECLVLKNKPREEVQTGKKKKGKKGAEDDEDLDAILASLGVVNADEKSKKKKGGAPPVSAEKKPEPAASDESPRASDDGNDDDDTAGLTAKQIANRKKKDKKKAAAKAKGAADEEEEAAAAADDNEDKKKATAKAKGATEEPKKKGLGSKAALLQERLAAQKALQAERDRVLEEARLADEEEERKEREEEERKAEQIRLRKEREQKKIDEEKRLGIYLTDKQKKERAAAEQRRKQLIDAGMIDADKIAAMDSRPKGPELVEVVLTQSLKDFLKKKVSYKKKEWIVDAPFNPANSADSADVKKLDAIFKIVSPEDPTVEDKFDVTDKKFAIGKVDNGLTLVLKRVPKINIALEKEDRKKKGDKSPRNAAGDMVVEDVASSSAADSSVQSSVEEEATPAVTELTSTVDSKDEPKKPAASPAKREKDWDESSSEEEDEPPPKEPVKPADGGGGTKNSDDGAKESDDAADEDSSEESSEEEEYLGLRSPIVCIMGHVDTGKTKLLDKIRRTNVQDGEAGGITQQIGATFFPAYSLNEQLTKVDTQFELECPGLMVIDTPGHESFNNLRKRGSSLCDLAILVIDIMHGLEPQTIESLEMLKQRRCNFVIALNKVDRLYEWKSADYVAVQPSLAKQAQNTQDEFQKRLGEVQLQLAEKGLNTYLYWDNPDYKRNISIVPTSAITGEGVPDLLYMLMKISQGAMSRKLEVSRELDCTVLEVKNIEGLGTTVDVVLVNGELNKGDQIVCSGLNGPIVTQVRALLTPQPLREMRVKGDYINHRCINTSMGVKIVATGLEQAVPGSTLRVVNDPDELEDAQAAAEDELEELAASIKKQDMGVYVQASTLGSLEALAAFLESMNIPIFGSNIGIVHKKDVKKASLMRDKGKPEYAVILAFDVKVDTDAAKEALRSSVGVKIFTADIIYHLFDQFTKYMEEIREIQKKDAGSDAVFPCVLKILPEYVINRKNPIVIGVEVQEGIVKAGTPLCVPEHGNLEIGKIESIEKDRKAVSKAVKGESVAIKISANALQAHIVLGRHFSVNNALYSKITRASIDTLKEHYTDEMDQPAWKLVVALKKVFNIQ